MKRVSSLGLAIAMSVALSPGPASATGSAARAAAGSSARADFNGDGFSDAAFAVYGEKVEGVDNAGAVNVLYGSPRGLAAAGNQFWTQNTPGVKDAAGSQDLFGTSIAAGDFNGDGYSDLAVGVPNEDVGGQPNAGAVNVLFGSPSGLRVAGNLFLRQGRSGVPGSPGDGFSFGSALAVGDFGKGPTDDLAVGIPGADVSPGMGSPLDEAGAVDVLYGSSAGIRTSGNKRLTERNDGVSDIAAGDSYGSALAAGDLGKDGHSDLVVGVPFDDLNVADQGSVHLLFGSPTGVKSTGGQLISQDSPGVRDVGEPQDYFGWSLAAGNFGKDRHADLAVGVRGEKIGSATYAGGVDVLYGSPSGIGTTGNQFWTQNKSGIHDSPESNDYFGWSVAAANFGHDRRADLAIGILGESVRGKQYAGAVQILYGSPAGLTGAGNKFFSQDTPHVPDRAEGTDEFGASLWAGNFGRSRQADLAVGAPVDSVGSIQYAGIAIVLYGSSSGLVSRGAQRWSQDSSGIKDKAETQDFFAGPAAL